MRAHYRRQQLDGLRAVRVRPKRWTLASHPWNQSFSYWSPPSRHAAIPSREANQLTVREHLAVGRLASGRDLQHRLPLSSWPRR